MPNFYTHPNALCDAPEENIGEGTRIWAFAHVLPEAKIGKDCNICDGVFVENEVVVGDRVTVKCGVQLWDGVTLEDDVFVGPNATFTNDRFPRSRAYLEDYLKTVIRKGATIGANATILPGIEVGPNAMVGAGTVVTKSVPANAIIVGNPGRIIGYVDANNVAAYAIAPSSFENLEPGQSADLGVSGCSLHRMKLVQDMRGRLTVGEYEDDIPFTPKRYFMVFDVPSQEVRGEHAHKECEQFLICIRGACSVLLDDGKQRCEIKLDSPDKGVFMPAGTWGTQYKYSGDAVLLVFASHGYDPDDYIRTYDEFEQYKKAG